MTVLGKHCSILHFLFLILIRLYIFIRLWDIEEIYTGKRGSMNASMHGAGGSGIGGSMHGSIQGSVHGGGVGASTHGISPNKGIGTLFFISCDYVSLCFHPWFECGNQHSIRAVRICQNSHVDHFFNILFYS